MPHFHRLWGFVLFLAFAASSDLAVGQERRSHIPREQVEQMFSQMRANAPWNVDGPLLWGFYFTSPNKAALESASTLLAQQGFRVVDIHLGQRQSPKDPEIWWLHVERVEHLTADSLDRRNADLDAFARERQPISYDGMDVGPAP